MPVLVIDMVKHGGTQGIAAKLAAPQQARARLLLAVLTSVLALPGTGTLQALGARVELAGQDSRLVAGGWLRAHGLIPAGVRRRE